MNARCCDSDGLQEILKDPVRAFFEVESRMDAALSSALRYACDSEAASIASGGRGMREVTKSYLVSLRGILFRLKFYPLEASTIVDCSFGGLRCSVPVLMFLYSSLMDLEAALGLCQLASVAVMPSTSVKHK